jgi:hypothetical protein
VRAGIHPTAFCPTDERLLAVRAVGRGGSQGRNGTLTLRPYGKRSWNTRAEAGWSLETVTLQAALLAAAGQWAQRNFVGSDRTRPRGGGLRPRKATAHLLPEIQAGGSNVRESLVKSSGMGSATGTRTDQPHGEESQLQCHISGHPASVSCGVDRSGASGPVHALRPRYDRSLTTPRLTPRRLLSLRSWTPRVRTRVSAGNPVRTATVGPAC